MILLVDFGSSKVPDIYDAVDQYMDCQITKWDELDLAELATFSGVILSGAPKLITEMDLSPILLKFSWILDYQKPILGICFGHQILGILHGAFGSKMKEDRDWQEIEVFEESPLFKAIPTLVNMTEDHCETISIPAQFKLIASSDACVNEAMEHNSKPFYGVQFHPETSGNMGYRLIENFCKICEEKR
jgi:GMP synthase (glutamine-hydrolysing)